MEKEIDAENLHMKIKMPFIVINDGKLYFFDLCNNPKNLKNNGIIEKYHLSDFDEEYEDLVLNWGFNNVILMSDKYHLMKLVKFTEEFSTLGIMISKNVFEKID